MTGLIVDLETSSANRSNCWILELAYCQFDFAKKRMKWAVSYLIKPHSSFSVDPEITGINGIDDELLKGREDTFSLSHFKVKELESDFICAHNGHNFDFAILERYGWRNQICKIDSYKDLAHPIPPGKGQYTQGNLGQLYQIPNFISHSALGDCLQLIGILQKHDYLDQIQRRVSVFQS